MELQQLNRTTNYMYREGKLYTFFFYGKENRCMKN